jgi:hypothetical protein
VEGNGPRTRDQLTLGFIDEVRTPEKEVLRLDLERWQLGTPELVKALPTSAIAAGSGDEVTRVVVDLGLRTERWLRALEFKPGDRRVVRAVFFTLQETGQWLGSWTPWHGVTALPPGTAYRLPAGARVVAEIHLRGTDETVAEQGTLGLHFTAAAPKRAAADLVVEAARAASNGSATKYSGALKVSGPLDVLALRPHLEPGVSTVEVSARKPDGTVAILLLLRNPLPEWPTPYLLKEAVALPRGSELRVTQYFDSQVAPPPSGSVEMTLSVAGGTR